MVNLVLRVDHPNKSKLLEIANNIHFNFCISWYTATEEPAFVIRFAEDMIGSSGRDWENSMNHKITAAVVLLAFSGISRADISLNGVLGGGDSYANSETVTWFNGHQTANSIYGDFDNQFATTRIRYGASTLAGDSSGTQYFFLHIETPLYAKNMIWQDMDWRNNFPIANMDPDVGLTEDDVASYRIHHETHHNPGDMQLNFNGATGSEKMVFLNSNGNRVFQADLAGNTDNSFGLIDVKDSVDYLFDNNISTEALSLARNTTMSFEFQFALDSAMNDQILDYIRNGIEFHLSPERGLPVPAPMSGALLGLGGLATLRRRRTNS